MSVCVFGDSIAWGAYDPEHGGWVTLLRNYVEQEWERFDDISVYNLSICDETTTKLIARLEIELDFRQGNSPNYLIIAVGTNDARYIKTPSVMETKPDQFVANVRKIISLVEKHTTSKAIFVGLVMGTEDTTTPLYGEIEPGYYYLRENLDHYNKLLSKTVASCGHCFIDFSKLLNTQTDYDSDDGLHPNTAGHRKIFEAVLPYVEKMLSST